MPEDVVERREEVLVGHRVFVSDSRPRFVGEKVRFRGKNLGHYTAETSLDDVRLKRTDVIYTLYQCPSGYRIACTEVRYQRRRERSRWTTVESSTNLLPKTDETNVDNTEGDSIYGAYSEAEARRMFPNLFSAVGMPNVRELD